MIFRQTRDLPQLLPSRMLYPGEIDHLIARDQLVVAPLPATKSPTAAACARLYHRYVEPATGAGIPNGAFCDVPRWVFLEYVVQHCEVLLVGANAPDLTELEPMVLSRNVWGWERPRLHAFAEAITPIFHAILDRQRLKELDCPRMTTIVQPPEPESGGDNGDGSPRYGAVDPQRDAPQRCYFGIDYRALPHAPWRQGTVYLYSRADLPPDFHSVPYVANLTEKPIRPLAHLSVDPWDWPLLDQVHGLDIRAQHERQGDTFQGFPWPQDPVIHPTRRTRPLAEQVRAFLEANYAESVCLESLGGQFDVSPFSLLRLFRAHFGLSPREYQTLLRVRQAKRLLQNDLPIAEAAAEVGFCDQTHLGRHFRRIVGLTPGNYLRMQESPIRAA